MRPQGIQTQKLTTEQRQEKLFEKLELSNLGSWSPELAESTWLLLARNHNLFSLEPHELSCTHLTEHVIKVTDNALFKEQFRWIPPLLVEEVHTCLWEMLDSGALCPSQSVWCNKVVLVQKKDGSLHFCIDFCHLNAHMKKDSYPLPRIQEALKSLVSAGHFSCLDLKSRFWQIKMDELSKQYTTFTVGNLGFFKCDHMPFGLCNMPATFQRLMQNCLRELNLTYCLIYLDHIIIFSQAAREHLHPLHIIFDQFREHNLKLNLSKCDFFRNKITYVAHWVLKDRVHPINSNLEAITKCAWPQTYSEVHTFLSLVAHYRRCIKGFACIAQPLSEYLVREGASRKSDQVSLTEEAMKAFKALKQVCMTASLLVIADYIKLFLLEINASKDGLGVVLSQKQADRSVSAHCLWQKSPDATWEELSLNQTWVSGVKMGSYRAL